MNQLFNTNCHLSIPSCQVMQIGNSYNWQTSRPKLVCIHAGYKQESLRKELKKTHIKSTKFFVVIQKYLKQLQFSLVFIFVYNLAFFKGKKTCQENKMTCHWPGQFFYYMKLGVSASIFCQIQLQYTLGAFFCA